MRTKKALQQSAPCLGPGECDHSDAEHLAFDQGLAAGERGIAPERCPYRELELQTPWLTGHSVGALNREAETEAAA